MKQASFDPGLTQQVTGTLTRAINKDGSFNVERRGASWHDIHPYLHLINASWPVFLGIVFIAYLVVNTIFAVLYFFFAPGQIQGITELSPWIRFLEDFFFSAHTLTTVGYGNFAPAGMTANAIAAFEAMTGLMGFALATGLLFGRVSKPSAKIGYSTNALIAPYQDQTSLQFRIVNRRSNVLIELQASVLLMTVEGPPGQLVRKYQVLPLERERVYFFPLTWTVVHPIDESSPLWRKTPAELEKLQAEVLILIKAFDETFSQTVNSRYSYRYDEIIWDARFQPAFQIDGDGRMVLDVDRVGAFGPQRAVKACGTAEPEGPGG
jgi:inward rectifier potassium channel